MDLQGVSAKPVSLVLGSKMMIDELGQVRVRNGPKTGWDLRSVLVLGPFLVTRSQFRNWASQFRKRWHGPGIRIGVLCTVWGSEESTGVHNKAAPVL